MTTTTLTNAQVIAEQNDLFRSFLPANVCIWKGHIVHGQPVCTDGIMALRSDHLDTVMDTVRDFSDFTGDNDPHQKHDFGSFVLDLDGEETTINWKFDYYAPDYEHGSENPADPRVTRRVLTVMLACEY